MWWGAREGEESGEGAVLDSTSFFWVFYRPNVGTVFAVNVISTSSRARHAASILHRGFR